MYIDRVASLTALRSDRLGRERIPCSWPASTTQLSSQQVDEPEDKSSAHGSQSCSYPWRWPVTCSTSTWAMLTLRSRCDIF